MIDYLEKEKMMNGRCIATSLKSRGNVRTWLRRKFCFFRITRCPRPCSTRFCRPIRFQFKNETTEIPPHEMVYIENQEKKQVRSSEVKKQKSQKITTQEKCGFLISSDLLMSSLRELSLKHLSFPLADILSLIKEPSSSLHLVKKNLLIVNKYVRYTSYLNKSNVIPLVFYLKYTA